MREIGITLAIFLFMMTAFVGAQVNLTDIQNHWGKIYIQALVSSGAVNGYPNGEFRPDNTISRAEFTKIFITALGNDLSTSKQGHWAQNHVDKAMDLNLLNMGEFDDLDKQITRGEMARMISRYMNENVDTKMYEGGIADISKMPSEYKGHVLKTYALGIISGYEDGTFRYDRSATRAEASVMIMRVIDESLRAAPKAKETQKVFDKEELSKYNGQNGMPAYIAFEGMVYDVTGAKAWEGGKHRGISAGQDITQIIKSASHGTSVIDNLEEVGKYEE